jgi:hypothetical protein
MTTSIRHQLPAIFLAISTVLLLAACGDKFDTADLGTTAPPDSYGDTSYVLQQPVWTGFSEPADVHLGFEPFIYVAERGADRVTMLDVAGNVVGSSAPILNPTAISQDYRLDLLVCGEFDTTIGGRSATFGAIYRINMMSAGHNIANAAITRVYFSPLNPNRRFTGITVLADNSYYVTRTGPSNNSPVDPDDAIMLFDSNDGLRPRVEWPGLSVDGTGLATLTVPTSITTVSRFSTDFIFTQKGEKSLFRTQWITQRTTGDVTQWQSFYTPARDGDIDFLRVSLFNRPEDVTVDDAGNVFVIDAGLDSLFRFNASGFISQAFGGAEQFQHPEGVAYFDKILYIADTGNDRILRFVLSTELK